MSTLVDRLLQHYRDDPERVFCVLIQEGATREVTYGELLRRGQRYLALYEDKGAEPGDIVISILRHGPDLLCSFVGALLGGMVPSIMPFPSEKQDPRLYWDSLERLLRRIDARIVVTYDENLEELGRFAGDGPWHVVTPGHLDATDDPVPPGARELRIAPDEVAFLQHTSGTTGLKKGIALSHRSVLEQLESYAGVLRLDGDDCIVSWLPLYHDMGLIACFILPMMLGVRLVLIDPFEWVYRPSILFDAVAQHRGTLVWLPNFAFHHLAATIPDPDGYDLSSVRAFIDCSEPCKPGTFRMFADAFAGAGVAPERLQTCYAMAETVFAVTQSRVGEHPPVIRVDRAALLEHEVARDAAPDGDGLEFLSVGRPIPGLEVSILDGRREPLPEGRVGEVAVTGNCLFSGYFRQPEITREAFAGEWYCTGDLGFLRDGELYITGRKKDVLIVNGRNYYAHDLEYAASRVDGVKPGRCVAISVFNELKGSEEVVIVAETELDDPDERARARLAVKEAVLSDLGIYLRDVHLVPLKWLIKTTSGKISRKENARKYLDETEERGAE